MAHTDERLIDVTIAAYIYRPDGTIVCMHCSGNAVNGQQKRWSPLSGDADINTPFVDKLTPIPTAGNDQQNAANKTDREPSARHWIK